ncbi:MAG TPA: FHA domain-containing protein [Ktedonobacteraceae bacterium]|nr:FHA domain-containing protein [Ktedonobacteraceae bacterium]
MDKKCPYCGAETRPGDNYCLNCGNPLIPVTPGSAPSQQGQNSSGDPTLASPDDWAASVPNSSSAGSNGSAPTNDAEISTQNPEHQSAPAAILDKIEQPARLILHSDIGEVVNDYALDKPEIAVGRAPQSDILLSKDKLTSRRHATITYEQGQYILKDEHSANGTFVNGQQLEEMTPYTLHDGDHVGIGEHELIFRTHDSPADAIEHAETIVGPFQGNPSDEQATVAASADDEAHPAHNEAEAPVVPATGVADMPATPLAPAASVPPVTSSYQPEQEAPAAPSTYTPPESSASAPQDAKVTLSRLTTIAQPSLPDMTSLVAALSTLDGQIASLQEQFNTTQESMRNHESEIAGASGQLRADLRRVCDRMDNTIADVARNREALAWSELTQLIEDVMNNPRDIEYVTKLARKARDLNKIFQLHQNVLNTMAECNSLLRGLIGEDNQ